MTIKLLLLGSLSEIIGQDSITMESVDNTDDLRKKIETVFPKTNGCKYLIAINQEVIKNNVALKHDDEIALLPPFAGG